MTVSLVPSYDNLDRAGISRCRGEPKAACMRSFIISRTEEVRLSGVVRSPILQLLVSFPFLSDRIQCLNCTLLPRISPYWLHSYQTPSLLTPCRQFTPPEIVQRNKQIQT